MATNGRKPKPAAIKELTGRDHHSKKAPLVQLEIDFEANDTYDYLPDARTLWESLNKAGIVKVSDRLSFMRYANILGIYIEAARDVKERGQILNKDKSNERYNPSWRIMRDAQQELMRLEIEFGLTPSSKRRVMQPAEAKESEENDYETRRAEALRERHSRREFG